MEAKDTVMSDEQVDEIPSTGSYPTWRKQLLETQAEISFKAGIREVVEFLHIMPSSELVGRVKVGVTFRELQDQLELWGMK